MHLAHAARGLIQPWRPAHLQNLKTRGHRWSRALWTWGNADHGRGGTDGPADAPIFGHEQNVPEKITNPNLTPNLIKQVVCGGAHTLMITSSGRLFTTGLNDRGQLGNGHTESESIFREVMGLKSLNMAAAGYWHSAAVSKCGRVYTWGCNKHWQLGHPLGDSLKMLAEPQEVVALQGAKVVQVACGARHTAVLTDGGEVYTWGLGLEGRLGHGNEEDELLPKRVEALQGANIVEIAAGYDVTAAVCKSGLLYMWGYGRWRQLGQEDGKSRNVPVRVDINPAIKQVAIGGFHTAAVTVGGELLTWGQSSEGVLGLGNKVSQIVTVPTKVEKPSQMQNVKQVACGERHTLAVTGVGDVFAWGLGLGGQLGLGDDTDRYAPTQVGAFQGQSLRQVSAGLRHSAAF